MTLDRSNLRDGHLHLYLSRHYLHSCILKKKILKINMKGSKRRRRIKQNRKKVKMNKEGKTYSSGEDGNLVRGDVRSVNFQGNVC